MVTIVFRTPVLMGKFGITLSGNACALRGRPSLEGCVFLLSLFVTMGRYGIQLVISVCVLLVCGIVGGSACPFLPAPPTKSTMPSVISVSAIPVMFGLKLRVCVEIQPAL